MAEENISNVVSSSFETENDIPGSSANDFCLLSEDDIAEISQDTFARHTETNRINIGATSSATDSSSVDVQAIKRKAEEIASSLQKFRSNVNKNANAATVTPQNKELPEDIKRHRERSLFVAQKLKEDKILYEESKKRNEAMSNKVRTAQRIHKNNADNVRQLKREETDETNALRIKIERLEASMTHLQECLNDKNKIISEKNETIRTLNESITNTYDAHMHSLEQSEEEIRRLKEEYSDAIEKITSSKDEFCNQLQVVRKKCLSVENDLKLSNFARNRLVNRNAELQERINELETENNRLASTINKKETLAEVSVEDKQKQSRDIAVIAIDDLLPKVEFLVFITNEYSSLITDNAYESEDLCVEEDILKTFDQLGDRLESSFYNIRDKFSSLPKLKNDMDKLLKKLKDETLQRESQLNEKLSSVELKLHSEVTANEELKERLCSIQSSNDEWSTRYNDLNKLNEQLQYQLSILQDEVNSDDTNYQLEELQNAYAQLKAEHEAKSKENEHLLYSQEDLNEQLGLLQNECIRLKNELETRTNEYEKTQQNLNMKTEGYEKLYSEYELLRNTYEDLNKKCYELANEVNTKSREYENLRAEYEQARRASEHPEDGYDKFENDFVLLQKRDCDEEDNWKRYCKKLRDENEQLLENVRSMSEKAIEYENERLSLNKYVDECRRLQDAVARLSGELETANPQIETTKETKKDSEDARDEEIEGLQEEMAKLVQQLSQVWDQLHDEKSSNDNLKEQLHYSEEVSMRLSKEVHELQEQNRELGNLRRNNEELAANLAEIRQKMDWLEVEKQQLLMELNEYKCAAVQPEDEVSENWQHKYNELLATKSSNEELESWKQHVIKLEELLHDTQTELQATKNDLEHARQQLQEIKSLNNEEQSAKTDLEQSYQQLQKISAEQAELLERSQFELQTANTMKNDREDLISRLQTELDNAKANLLREIQIAAEQAEILQCTQSELQVTRNELGLVYEQLQETQTTTDLLVANCTREVESLKGSIAEAKNENELLRKKCESQFAKYNNLYSHVNLIMERAKNTSDDAARILQKLQTQWKPQIDKIDVTVQCDDEMDTAHLTDIYENSWRAEAEKYEMTLHDIQQELDSLQGQYAYAKQQLVQKDEEYSVEITRYENLLTQLRSELGVLQERVAFSERQLVQKDEDWQQYKSSKEMFIESERVKHQRYIDEIRQHKVQTTDATSQVSDFDFRTPADVSQSVTTVSEQSPGLIKYFDYYKEKVTKEFSSILQPEEQVPDYSAWILPDEQERRILQSENQGTDERLWPSQTSTQNQGLQANQLGLEKISASVAIRESPTQHSHYQSPPVTQLSVSNVVDQLKSLVLNKYDKSGWDLEDGPVWIDDQLDSNDSEFINTAFKFADLFDTVIQYYSSLPGTDEVLTNFKYIIEAAVLREPVTNLNRDNRETLEEFVNLATRLECENKYLSDAIICIEDSVMSRVSVEVIRLQTVIDGWRGAYAVEETDVIDRICEDYDIVPTKFVPGELFTQWKENLIKLLEPSVGAQRANADGYCQNLQVLKNKVQKLICDLHYIYSDENTFNPRDFFEQIEDINTWVARSLNVFDARGNPLGEIPAMESERPAIAEEHEHHHEDDAHKHHHEHHKDHHDDVHIRHEEQDREHDHEDHHDHHHGHQDHNDQHFDQQELDQKKTVVELKALLAESNKKIAQLVHELMDVKKSREYNEVRQLHLRLDETLYQLHLRDVHVVELTQELTQLLSERDALQLKLSNILRENEQLRKSSFSVDSSAQSANLSNKLEELHTVNYMKDPLISEASKQYHAAEMQLFNDDQSGRNKPESSGFSVPSLFKWITGETETK